MFEFFLYTLFGLVWKVWLYKKTLKETPSHKNYCNDNYNCYSDTICYISIFDLVVYTVWACLKGVTPYKAFKEESTNKSYFNDNYSAPFACRSFALFSQRRYFVFTYHSISFNRFGFFLFFQIRATSILVRFFGIVIHIFLVQSF